MPDSGARFELFAKGTAWDTNIYLLDTKYIRAYSPAASMDIETEDPYVRGDPTTGTYVKRTRADRPITLHAHVSGLVSSFRRSLLAQNKSPKTVETYLDAVDGLIARRTVFFRARLVTRRSRASAFAERFGGLAVALA